MQQQNMAHGGAYPSLRGRLEQEPRRPRRHAARVASILGWGLFGLVGLAVYANVFSDDTALRARTAQLARERAGCGEACRITQVEIRRSVLAYRADYEIAGVGTLHVTCGRTAVAVGPLECRVQ